MNCSETIKEYNDKIGEYNIINERNGLFIDKYRPENINDIFFHDSLLKKLVHMSKDNSIPHIIFHGPEGSGKKTVIRLFLEMLYGSSINKTSETIYNVSGSGNSTIQVPINKSNFHIIIEPNNNNFDRYLVQEVVKEYAKKIPFNVFNTKKKFKVVLINNVANMSYYAQTSLRRTLEKYSDTCRFIMWCRSLSKVIDPLRSRCLCIGVKKPSRPHLFQRLYTISVMERMKINLKVINDIIDKSNLNIKKSLWLLQLYKNGHDLINNYDRIIDKIVLIIKLSNIDYVTKIRALIYNIMITNISGTKIIIDILQLLLKSDDICFESKHKIIKNASIYEHNLVRGRREIIHLDAFVIKIITILYNDNNYYPNLAQIKGELIKLTNTIDNSIKKKENINANNKKILKKKISVKIKK